MTCFDQNDHSVLQSLPPLAVDIVVHIADVVVVVAPLPVAAGLACVPVVDATVVEAVVVVGIRRVDLDFAGDEKQPQDHYSLLDPSSMTEHSRIQGWTGLIDHLQTLGKKEG